MTASHLVPCVSCARHIRASEERCPFCLAPLVVAATARPAPSFRLSRAALVAFGMGALALSPAAGCSSSSTTLIGSGSSSGATCLPSNCAPPYGLAPFEDAAQPEDGSLHFADAQVSSDAQVSADAADGSTADGGSDGGGDGEAGDAGGVGDAGDASDAGD